MSRHNNYLGTIMLVLVLLIMLTGCQKHNPMNYRAYYSPMPALDSVIQSDTLNMEMRFTIERQIVLEQVKNIYRVVKADYMTNGGSYETEFFDRAYCSKAWNKLLMSVRCKEERTNTLFFEINPWSMMRYSGSIVSFDEFEVTDLVIDPKRKASVSFTVSDGDTYTPARIDLVYENGRWVIDNFYNLRYMLDIRNCMWQYLASNLNYM